MMQEMREREPERSPPTSRPPPFFFHAPIRQGRPHPGVVHQLANPGPQRRPGLVHRHLRQGVALIISGRLVGEDVGDGEEGAGRGAALDGDLHLVRQGGHPGRGDLVVGQLVQGLFEKGDGQHGTQAKDRVGAGGPGVGFDDRPGHRLARPVAGVPGQPGRVPD